MICSKRLGISLTKILALALLLYAGPGFSEEATMVWMTQNANSGIEPGQSVAIDETGNVYVTGGNFVTVKYDSSGTQLWEAVYTAPRGIDRSFFVALDDAGDVYAAGSSYGPDTGHNNMDYVVVKYNGSTGAQIWEARYDPYGYYDEPIDFTVDGSGNAYVTGRSNPDGNKYHFNFATVKYDTSSGTELWTARYSGAGMTTDAAHAIGVDDAGNVYVTGTSTTLGLMHTDLVTIMYDASGSQLWVDSYDGPIDLASGANDLALDASGNIYVAGGSCVELDPIDSSECARAQATAIKYSPTGSRLWLALTDLAGSCEGRFIEVNPLGDVYVAGYITGAGTTFTDNLTIKYNAGSGSQQWAVQFDGPAQITDSLNAMDVDDSGNVYLTGTEGGGVENSKWTTYKYDPSGTRLWLKTLRIGGYEALAEAIAVNDLGYVYVIGNADNCLYCGNIQMTTVKYGPDTDEDGLADELDPCPSDRDCDDDGLTDGNVGSEDLNANGIVDSGETDPTLFDTDADGISDGVEKGLSEPEDSDATDPLIFMEDTDPATTTDPTNPDTDGDGTLDGVEDANQNGKVDIGETDPNDGDEDGCVNSVDPAPYVPSADEDSDGYGADCDCNDANGNIYPGADEICDNLGDDDCDALIDYDDPECGQPPWGASTLGATSSFTSNIANYLALFAPFLTILIMKGLRRKR